METKKGLTGYNPGERKQGEFETDDESGPGSKKQWGGK